MPINKNEITIEQIEKAMQCKTADELIAYAKTEGVEITKDEAEAYLAELSECELKDGELRYVAGGRYDQMNDSNKGCWPAICVSNDH